MNQICGQSRCKIQDCLSPSSLRARSAKILKKASKNTLFSTILLLVARCVPYTYKLRNEAEYHRGLVVNRVPSRGVMRSEMNLRNLRTTSFVIFAISAARNHFHVFRPVRG
jgi:hypothetical protein